MLDRVTFLLYHSVPWREQNTPVAGEWLCFLVSHVLAIVLILTLFFLSRTLWRPCRSATPLPECLEMWPYATSESPWATVTGHLICHAQCFLPLFNAALHVFQAAGMSIQPLSTLLCLARVPVTFSCGPPPQPPASLGNPRLPWWSSRISYPSSTASLPICCVLSWYLFQECGSTNPWNVTHPLKSVSPY